jgi:hypothetical protein
MMIEVDDDSYRARAFAPHRDGRVGDSWETTGARSRERTHASLRFDARRNSYDTVFWDFQFSIRGFSSSLRLI